MTKSSESLVFPWPIDDHIRALFHGVRLGDSLGRVAEGMSRAQILQHTQGRGFQGFEVPENLPRRVWVFEGREGCTTDDWAMTEMVLESLTARRTFDLEDIARRHVAELNWPYGWGGTSKAAISEIRDFYAGKGGRSPYHPAPPPEGNLGAGNGPAMKVSPLVPFWIFYAKQHQGGNWNPERIHRWTVELGAMTHGDPVSIVTANVLRMMLSSSLMGFFRESVSVQSTKAYLENLISGAGALFGCGEALSALGPNAENLRGRVDARSLQAFTEHLHWAAVHGHSASEAEFAANFVDRYHPRSFYLAIHSVAAAIAVFVRHPKDFRSAMRLAVNMGGDTDTVASMAGALVGANVGMSGIPKEWMDFRPDLRDEVDQKVDAFLNAFNVTFKPTP